MHTSTILRSDHFRVTDDGGTPMVLTGGLRSDDRLGIVSPRYEDALLGASGVILAFVTAFYDIQRALQAETGQPFFIYPDYYAFFLGESDAVRGQAGTAALGQGVSNAYGWLDVWPEEKWVVAQDAGALWTQVAAHRITHLLLPAEQGNNLGAVPEMVRSATKDIYRYLPPGDSAGRADALSIELATAPIEIIGRALAYLPSESPARSIAPPTSQRLVRD